MENSGDILVKIILSLSKIQDIKNRFEKGLISEIEFNEEVSLHDVQFNSLNVQLSNSLTGSSNKLMTGFFSPMKLKR